MKAAQAHRQIRLHDEVDQRPAVRALRDHITDTAGLVAPIEWRICGKSANSRGFK
jgi:hypothetical protein